jgi:NTP pyrophosphatase (non-canonical NTP hydrolase)
VFIEEQQDMAEDDGTPVRKQPPSKGEAAVETEPPGHAMTLRAAQDAVDRSIQALGGYWPPLANLARLFEECGELARVVNQTHGPKLVKSGETQALAAEELGDVLYTLLVLANSLGVDTTEALQGVLGKVGARAGADRVHHGAAGGGASLG